MARALRRLRRVLIGAAILRTLGDASGDCGTDVSRRHLRTARLHSIQGRLASFRAIFQRHTDLIEPLSLDEAYLDVTENKMQLPTATRVAKMIREQIREELNLTASAGVAPNKFLAKIASDWKKPNGLFVIQPHEVQSFLLPLARARSPIVTDDRKNNQCRDNQ